MSGPDTGRTHVRMLWASILALFLEAALAVVLGVIFGDTRQPEPGEERVSALSLLVLPFLPVLALLPAAAVSAVIVLPTVLLGEDLARRAGGRPLWWHLLLSAAAGALLLPLAGGWGWALGAVCVAVAALLARPARKGYFVSLLLWGTAAVLTVLMLGGAGLYTGVLES
ncbi:hypothetical protein [Streptomyces vietnamensis]|uniref:hypothetical protein n=1 Tax=Streptomyces vietnamensis TaxID=362257 RepID=UPI00131CD76C|nr:hypothetical protein [Streptomyces vietnamensis]